MLNLGTAFVSQQVYNVVCSVYDFKNFSFSPKFLLNEQRHHIHKETNLWEKKIFTYVVTSKETWKITVSNKLVEHSSRTLTSCYIYASSNTLNKSITETWMSVNSVGFPSTKSWRYTSVTEGISIHCIHPTVDGDRFWLLCHI